jgi:limonene 1,2-monooxygenase
MYSKWPLKFGMFFPPIHAPSQNANLALHRDAEQIIEADRLGFDEAWVGEHHSGGWEIVGAPEVFLAYVAAKTQRIKLGTGVISLPYHNPYQAATRMVLLDHLTRGRAIMGLGPGSLPWDPAQFGQSPLDSRRRLEEGAEVIMELLTSDEPVTRKTDWFDLVNARLNLKPYTQPNFEIAVSALASPNGPRLAGRLGASLLSIFATSKQGYGALPNQWGVVEEEAKVHGHKVDRRNWRLVGPMHIAETEEEAYRQVQYGLKDWIYYSSRVATLGIVPEDAKPEDYAKIMVESGLAVIGTPDQAVAQIKRLWDNSGGFGTFVIWSHDWANPADTLSSYELFARYVMPSFQNQSRHQVAAQTFAQATRGGALADASAARNAATEAYEAERAARK